jgi:hypothetical protein
MNQLTFRHSARNLPLNDSTKTLRVGLPGRLLPYSPRVIDHLPLASRPHIIWRMTSCRIYLSSERSTTIRFNLLFYFSSYFSRFVSGGISPSHFFRQLQNVASVIPAFRHTSKIAVPSPAHCRMNAVWLSVYFKFFMESPPGGQGS